MKMTKEHFVQMETAIKAVLAEKPNIAAEYKARGLSNMRLNWDVLSLAKIEGDSIRWMCDKLYPYLNDTHIHTALKAIMGNDGSHAKVKTSDWRPLPPAHGTNVPHLDGNWTNEQLIDHYKSFNGFVGQGNKGFIVRLPDQKRIHFYNFNSDLRDFKGPSYSFASEGFYDEHSPYWMPRPE